MRVIVSGELCATTGSTNIHKIHQLLLYACQGRHVVSFDPPESLDQCLTMFSGNVGLDYKNLIEATARHATGLPADAATVLVKLTATPVWDDPVAQLSLDDALRVLDEPLSILVEDIEADWSFLLGIMRASERDKLLMAVEHNWVKPIHGGGSGLKKQLLSRLQMAHKILRTFALFDSDRLHPDELISDWTPIGPCEGYNIEQVARSYLPCRYWMLERRSIESYMPKSHIAKMINNVHRDASDAFFRLTPAGRWYFNMKSGFNGDRDAKKKARQKDLYNAVSLADRAALQTGFSGQLAKQYQQALHEAFDWDSEARREAARSLPHLMRIL